MTVINWTAKDEPWRSIGQKFAQEVKAIISGVWPVTPIFDTKSKVYQCKLCNFVGHNQQSLNGHMQKHKKK